MNRYYGYKMEHFIMSEPQPDNQLATKTIETRLNQWHELRETLIKLGHRVTEITPTTYAKDFHLTAKHAMILDGKAMLGHNNALAYQSAPYFAAAAQVEQALSHIAIAQNHLHPDHKSPLAFGGSTDTLFINDSILMNYGVNTAIEMANRISSMTGKKVIDLSLRKKESCLMDAILSVNEGQLICDLDLIETNSLSYLTEVYEIIGCKDDPKKKPTHTLMTSTGAIVPENCYETQEQLSELGYDVHTIAFDTFQNIGYGPRAMTLCNAHSRTESKAYSA